MRLLQQALFSVGKVVSYLYLIFNSVSLLVRPLLGEAPLDLDPSDAAAANGPLRALLEGRPVPPELLGGLLVERVVGVGLQEEVLQPVHDRVDGQHCHWLIYDGSMCFFGVFKMACILAS